MGLVDDLLQGGLQGFMTGKQMQRQSLLDQLQQQKYKEELDLQKQELNLRAKAFQFQQQESQRKGLLDQLEQERENLENMALGFRPGYTAEPQQTFDVLGRFGQMPAGLQSMVSEPTAQVSPESLIQPNVYIQQKRALDIEQQRADIDYKKAQAQAQRSLATTRQSKITDATKLGFKGSDAVRLVNDYQNHIMQVMKYNADAQLMDEPTIEITSWEEWKNKAAQAQGYTGKGISTPQQPTGKVTEQEMIDSLKESGVKSRGDFDINLIIKKYPYLNKETILKAFGT